jgi:hypothetical protein
MSSGELVGIGHRQYCSDEQMSIEPQRPIHSDVLDIATRHTIDTQQLAASFQMADGFLAELVPMLARDFPKETLPGVEILVIGSIAKRQCTRGSDVDFFGIVEEPPDKSQTDPIVRAIFDKAHAMGFDLPFAAGITGVFVPRAEIEQLHVITDDTRKRFRRMTMVTASMSVYRPEMRTQILHNLLDAFLGRDRTPRIRGLIDHLVINARLGNLVAEWMKTYPPPDGGFVNWSKCFTIYRIEYVSALAAIIRAGIAAEGRSRATLVETIATELQQSPLDRLARWYPELPPHGRDAVASMISISNDTLAIYARDGVRGKLAAGVDDAPTLAICAELEQQMRRVEAAIVELFFREGPLRWWTEHLGLFG